MSSKIRHPLGFAGIGALLILAVTACGGGRDISFIGIASASASTITSDSATVKADGVSFATVTVEVKDNNRNTLPTGGNAVALATTRGTLTPLVDGNNGRYVAQISSTQTGPAIISGSVEGSKITTGDLTVTFTP